MPIHRTIPPLVLALALGACNGNRERSAAANTPGGAETAALPADTAADTAASAPATASNWSDANVLAVLDHANKADSSAGALASQKAGNAQVKQFARLMQTEHHALRKKGQDLAKTLNITPEPPNGDPVTALETKETQALQSTAKGAQFDRTYIEQEVAAHQAVLDVLTRAKEQAQHEQLKTLIEDARPVIQQHLDKAQKIQQQLQDQA